ncbi:YjbQ family protein [Vallitalea okinawensis]|uniref:YjbQ family protein n=1 Tax=Vallitalea okinawensis TaxID=2078660 RepID=UPI000CFD4E9C|nr:YjbQ family protein [Vallitalea okinawensis]
MAVYSKIKEYQTKAHMGMIDVSQDFQDVVMEASREKGIQNGTITGFTTGGVAGLTTLEFEPGIVKHDLKKAMDIFSPYEDETGRVIHYKHHETWHDDNGSSHIKAALLSPFITIPIIDGKITLGPWQNLTLIECDTRDRLREIVFTVMGE